MTDDSLYQHLRQQAWRRKLSPPEQAQLNTLLAAHPEAREDWEEEKNLNALLARMTDVPVPSNFTARVLKSLEVERAKAQCKPSTRTWFFSGWRYGAATAILVALVTCWLSFVSLKNSKLERVRESLVTVSVLPGPEVLTNFDIICALDRTPPPDEELLKLLQ